MITLALNQTDITTPKDTSLYHLLAQYYPGEHAFAICLNQTFVPKSQYQNTILSDGDKIDLIHPMQGG